MRRFLALLLAAYFVVVISSVQRHAVGRPRDQKHTGVGGAP